MTPLSFPVDSFLSRASASGLKDVSLDLPTTNSHQLCRHS